MESIQLEEEFTPGEEQQHKRLLEKLAKAILALPEKDSQGFPYDGVIEMPTASVLGHIDDELIPQIHVLSRGDLGQLKERVSPGVPAVLSPGMELEEWFPPSARHRSRKKLALWLSQADHPLTARVMVNRIWQWHFGHGIVGTPNDFGRQGEEPSHPQLLDWLATEFAANGWSIKAMHRLIMESSTYRMSSRHPESSYARTDPENRLLWRMNRRRLEAEALWDSVHAVAGTLNLKLGGRSVSPPLSADEFDALSGNGPYEWFVSTDPADHRRRGIYIVVKRNFPFPMFEAFDLPDNSASCPEREVTTVTPQVLWFMNHELALSQAQHFAHRLLREEGTVLRPGPARPGVWPWVVLPPTGRKRKPFS